MLFCKKSPFQKELSLDHFLNDLKKLILEHPANEILVLEKKQMSHDVNHFLKTNFCMVIFRSSVLGVKLEKHVFKNMLKNERVFQKNLNEGKKGVLALKFIIKIELLNEILEVLKLRLNVFLCIIVNLKVVVLYEYVSLVNIDELLDALHFFKD